MKFLFVVLRCGLSNFTANLFHALAEVFVISTTFYNRRVVFGNHNTSCETKVGGAICSFLEFEVFKFCTGISHNRCTAHDDRQVFEHRFASLTKPWCFDCDELFAGKSILQQETQSSVFNVFSDDQETVVTFVSDDFLDDGQNFFVGRQFFLTDENVAVFQNNFHFGTFITKNKMRRHIAAIKLHALKVFCCD